MGGTVDRSAKVPCADDGNDCGIVCSLDDLGASAESKPEPGEDVYETLRALGMLNVAAKTGGDELSDEGMPACPRPLYGISSTCISESDTTISGSLGAEF